MHQRLSDQQVELLIENLYIKRAVIYIDNQTVNMISFVE